MCKPEFTGPLYSPQLVRIHAYIVIVRTRQARGRQRSNDSPLPPPHHQRSTTAPPPCACFFSSSRPEAPLAAAAAAAAARRGGLQSVLLTLSPTCRCRMPHRRATALPPTKTDCSSPPSLHRRPLPRLETDDTRTRACPLLPSTHKLMRTPPPADTRRVACGDGTHTFELPFEFVLLLDTFLTNTHRVAAPADSSSLSIFL